MKKRMALAGIVFGVASLLGACGSTGIYSNVRNAGPTVQLESIHVSPETNLGYSP